jgi:hypothetical protein
MSITEPKDPPTDPTFIPISLVPDVPTIITGPTSVGFTVSVPSGLSQPALTVSFFEVNTPPTPSQIEPIHEDLPLDIIDLPINADPTWEESFARFTLDLNDSVFSSLNSRQTILAVIVRLTDPNISSLGMVGIPINLPPLARD